MSRKFIISEKQEEELIRRINEETYQMPVDKKMNTPYCINPDKVLIVKKFLDRTFTHHDFEKIGNNGMPIRIKIISMNATDGSPLKYMYKEQLHDLLIDRFQNMFLDKNERSLFMKQVINDWLSNSIGIFGSLSKNKLMENTVDEINDKANDANTNPTEKQREAGNYKKGHIRICGMPISIENPKGSYRKYKNQDGSEGKIKMKSHYGYFTNTTGNGKDGDSVDVFVGPNVDSFEFVYVVDQNNKDGAFDESKVMLGFNSIEHAKRGYMENYSSDWSGFSNITKVSLSVFKKWLYRDRKQRKPFSDYYYIRKHKLNESVNGTVFEIKIARIDSATMCEDIVEQLNKNGVNARHEFGNIYVDSNSNINECKKRIEKYLIRNSDINPQYALNEIYLNEEEYAQICKVIDAPSIDVAEEIADEINQRGLYAYTENNIVFVTIEQDWADTNYVEDTLKKCKILAYSLCTKHRPENEYMFREAIEREDIRKIGALNLISYDNEPWSVYDENEKYQGKFKGNINEASERYIYDNIE